MVKGDKMSKVPKTTDKTKLKLRMIDRLAIRKLFPQESNLVTQVLARDIDGKITVTQKEIDEIELRQEGTAMVWKGEKDKGKFIDFTDAEVEFLKKQIDEIDKKNKISSDMVNVCLKIRDIKSEKE